MKHRERFFNTLEKKNSGNGLLFIPITMMLAAEEIKVPYREYATDYRIQLKGQEAIADRYNIDHVSAVSDPAVEAADLGADVIYYDNQPPAINEANALIADKSVLSSLKAIRPENGRRMSNRVELVRRMKELLGENSIIEGWVEGPTSESADLRGISSLMMDLIMDQPFVRDLMEFTFEVSIGLAREQIRAGADIIGLGDAASSLVGPALYSEIIRDYQKRYIDAIHDAGAFVRLHICGNIGPILPMMKDLGMDILDLDSMVPVKDARKQLGPDVVLSGNIDPVRVVKDGRPSEIIEKLGECYRDSGNRAYAVNAGCEIPRGTPSVNIEAMRKFAETAQL